jgi:hypothetical protein
MWNGNKMRHFLNLAELLAIFAMQHGFSVAGEFGKLPLGWARGRRQSSRILPAEYRHNRTGEDNADAHLQRQVMGREVVVGITDGKLDFGPWEQIFYAEFDGKRKKRVLVKIIGE